MDEFWVCQHCRSLNKAGTGKCYSCREKYGTKPKEGAPVSKDAPPPPPIPPELIPDFGAASAPARSFSRPVALPPVTRPTDQAGGGSGRRIHLPSPAAAVRRHIARSLAMRQSVSVGWLGYVTAVLIALVLLTGMFIVLTVMPAAANLLQHADLATARSQLPAGQQVLLKFFSIVFLIAGVLALLCFSVFLGLTTHNATGLGAEQPLLIPYRAGTCWAGALWTQVRIAVGLMVPAALLWRGYEIPGLVAAIVAVDIANRHLEGTGGWLSRPYRHLPDLYDKLGTEGSISSPIVRIWSGCFRIANVLAIAVCAIPLLAFLLFIASAMTGHSGVIGWQSTGLGLDQIVVALLVVSLVGWTAVSFALLIPITLGLVRRQRTRKTLVRIGRSRSWIARPGQGAYNGSDRTQPGQVAGYDEDRIVERLPVSGGPIGPGWTDPRLGEPSGGASPGVGGSLFSGPRAKSPGIGDPDFDDPGFGEPGFRLPNQGSDDSDSNLGDRA